VPVVGVVVATVIVGAAFVLTNGFHPSKVSTSEDLVPALAYYSLPGQQYNSITFIVGSNSVINGTFTNTIGIAVYILSPTELAALNHNGVVSGYTWSSGTIANLTVYHLGASVVPGQWSLVFYNPNLVNTTVVGFYTAVTLHWT
jgi:hypothetical protein